MISRILHWYLNRHINRGFKQPEAGTRASTKLTEPYERRRTRELRIAIQRFKDGTAGKRLA